MACVHVGTIYKSTHKQPLYPYKNKRLECIWSMWIMRLKLTLKGRLMDFINNNADLVVWSVILAPFAYIGLKLALVMAYIIVAGIFGDKR